MAPGRVAVVAAMPNELRPFVRGARLRRAAGDGPWRYEGEVGGTEVVAATTGIGTAAAARTTERLLAAGPVAHLVMIGIAGGIAPAVRVGDVVVPDTVVDADGRSYRPVPPAGCAPRGTLSTSDELLSDPDVLSRLAADGVVALDMETASVGAVCERHGVPWSVVRAISDLAGATALDQAVLGLARPDGSPDVPAALRYVATRPWRLPGLARLARDASRAGAAAAAVALSALGGRPGPSARRG